MGFTLSHPALILPLRYLPRRFYSISGLIAGSIIPDFEYFIRFSHISLFSHTLSGLFWFDVPSAFLLLFFYHQFVRDAFIANLPDFLKFRLGNYDSFNWPIYARRNWHIVLISIFIGIFSHLFWDSWTSENGCFVERYPLLLQPFHFANVRILFYQIIKQLSSASGALIISWQLFRLPKRISSENRKNKQYWPFFFCLFFGIILLQILIGFPDKSFSCVVKKFLASALASLALVSLPFQRKRTNPYKTHSL